jgi:hypothetical protein
MVNLKTNEIIIGNEIGIIVEWEVWFQTPFGVTSDFKAAQQRVKDADLDPDTTIVPVPVAISGSLYEIVLRL